MDERAAFAGLRVVDISTGIAGPYATMCLADHGAAVVQVEPPGGAPDREEPGFQVLHRGKRSVTLDLDAAADRDRLRGLLATADVFVTDRPQAAVRALGLGEAALRARHPRLVVLGIPPFGEHGPLVRHPRSPGMVAAVGGIMDGQAATDGEPVYPVIPAASYGAGLLGAAAVAAALVARERTGRGRFMEVSELAGALAVQPGTVTADLLPGARTQAPALGPRGPVAPYALYEAAGGEWFFLACGTREFYDRMLVAIDRPELAADPRLRDAPWGLLGPEATAALQAELESLFRTRPRAEWLERFRAADVPAQPVWTREEFLASPLARESALLATVPHPELGAVVMPARPLTIEGETPPPLRPAPAAGADTAAVLAGVAPLPEPPAPPNPEAERAAAEPPLAGLRVLDASAYIAGPVTARHLAMLGADVVKVEPHTGDPFRVLALGFLGWNAGKRSIALDLRHPGGRALFDELLDGADVVVENARPRARERLGLDPQRLRARRPSLVHLSISGYGEAPAYRDLPAFDPLLQALTGAMAAQGGDGPPVYSSVALADVMTPLIGVFGVCAALYRRARTASPPPTGSAPTGGAKSGSAKSGSAASAPPDPSGAGGMGAVIHTSLVQAALAAQAREFVRYPGAPPPLTGGVDFPGPQAGQRRYRAGAGHVLYLEARDERERRALVDAFALDLDPAALAGPPDGAAAAAIAQHLRRATLSEVLGALARARVPHVTVTPHAALLESDAVRANRLTVRHHHPIWGLVTAPGQLVHEALHRDAALRRAPMLGEDALAILEPLGYDRIADYPGLVASGALGTGRVDVPPAEVLGVLFPDGRGDRLPQRQLWMVFGMDIG